jgi:4-amino-4-deoxychorismate lyase
MCLFVESIQLNEGKFLRLELHQERVCKAMKDFYPSDKVIGLAEYLNKLSFPVEGIYKCRLVYDSEIRKIEFTPYIPRKIQTLRLVKTEMDSTPYKKEDRSLLNAAYALRGDCDEIIMTKNGLVTDTSYTNIALFDGKHWVTPRIPLIYGVNRTELLNKEILTEKDITPDELVNFNRVSLFNAMNEFGSIELNISAIRQ